MKRNSLIASSYKEATIEIPYKRLREMLKKGDIIQGWPGCKFSAYYTGYRVTHIDWWGVFAVPTDEMLEKYKHNFKNNIKKHYKFKWQHITGVKFVEQIEE